MDEKVEEREKKDSLMGFGFALVQYFLTVPQLPCFGVVMYIMCHCM